jgi:ABC-type hemin transport system substrate-binding protein
MNADDTDRIRSLQLEACVYGDPEMVVLCERALSGDSDALHIVITMLDYASEAYHDHD